MKILDGKELAGFIKERQAREVASMPKKPKLLILRDSDNPVIKKYVDLKKQYGEDIGIEVIDTYVNTDLIKDKIIYANKNSEINGIIVQLPIQDKEQTNELTNLIAPAKDVDGLSENGDYDSATATAILWLLAGYDIKLENKSIAIVGRGKLVGAPLYKIFKSSNYHVDLFHKGSDLTKLNQYDIIITATGAPGLISNDYISPGATIIDAGTASEKGVLKGDLANEVRQRTDLTAITPQTGGVGPLTVSALFDHVIQAAKQTKK